MRSLQVLYLFFALAMIADEYLVPALDVLCQRSAMAPELAGLTILAVGGSAPELFASAIGTFTGSAVGFGTVVGATLIHILLVVGVCALYSRDTLQLAWRPLSRDALVFLMALLALATFFGIISPSQIESWEAATMLALYAAYVRLVQRCNASGRWLSDGEGPGHTLLMEEGGDRGGTEASPPISNALLLAFKVRMQPAEVPLRARAPDSARMRVRMARVPRHTCG